MTGRFLRITSLSAVSLFGLTTLVTPALAGKIVTPIVPKMAPVVPSDATAADCRGDQARSGYGSCSCRCSGPQSGRGGPSPGPGSLTAQHQSIVHGPPKLIAQERRRPATPQVHDLDAGASHASLRLPGGWSAIPPGTKSRTRSDLSATALAGCISEPNRRLHNESIAIGMV
jgi:hypothetical protein